MTDAVSIIWAVHHATQKRGKPFEVGISSLLPLIRAQAHSVKHAMEKIRDTVAFLNPGQTPVLAADQPLYALAKQIQLQWPDYGEDRFRYHIRRTPYRTGIAEINRDFTTG